MNRNKFNDMTNEGFDIKRAIPLTLREAKNAFKFRERRDGSSIEVCIYARARREKCSDTDFQNMDVTNLTGSDLLRLGRSKTGTLKIPDNTGGNETHENVVCYGLTRLDVIGEGQANLIINIAFDSAKIATKIEDVPKAEIKSENEACTVADLADDEINNNDAKIDPCLKKELKEEQVVADQDPNETEYVSVKRKWLADLMSALEGVKQSLADDDEAEEENVNNDAITDDEVC